jgi:hypothetical protein
MFLFIEKCDEQSLNNCWYARDNHDDFFWGGYEYDIVHRRIKYENGFYFLGDSEMINFLNKEEIFKIKYLQFRVKNTSNLGLAIAFMGSDFYNQLDSIGYFNYPYLTRTQKRISKKAYSIKKKYKYNLDKKIGPNKGKLFYVKLKYFVDDINLYASRQVLNIDKTGKLKRPFVKTINTKGKFITSIEEIMLITPY